MRRSRRNPSGEERIRFVVERVRGPGRFKRLKMFLSQETMRDSMLARMASAGRLEKQCRMHETN
jgi:hypothetical protein